MDIAPCKGMKFAESGNFCLWSPESGKKFAYGIRNRQGLGIQNTAQ